MAVAAILLCSSAFAQKAAKKPVDFNAKPDFISPVYGPTGVKVKIVSGAIDSKGVITARVQITDSAGNPLDRLGVQTPGAVSMSLICAVIPNGQTQYFSYTTSVAAATINNNPSQTQAANDSGGTWTQNAIGDYTYTFKTAAPTGYDVTATHTIGVSAQRDLSAFGTFTEWLETDNDTFNFVPNGTAVKTVRQVVATAACNQCHDPMYGHGGSRIKVELCIMCHQPQTINPDTQLTMDMKVLIHKIHDGSSLPSVVAGTPYRIWHRGAWSDFSTVVFPQDVRNCTTCHTAGATPQADNWKTNPSMAACGSCHDDVNFATGKNHVNYPVSSDTQCSACHASTKTYDFDASIPGAHAQPNYATALPGIVGKFVSVTNTAPGQAPTVTFSLVDKTGKGYNIANLTQVRLTIAGNNTDYGISLARTAETVPTTQTGSGGQYTYQMTTKLPTNAAGSYTISLEAKNTVTLLAGTTQQMTATDVSNPVEYYFSVDKSAVAPRRQVVGLANCSKCHSDLNFVHGAGRNSPQECVICHNPTLTDGTSHQSVNFAWQIHSIHRGESLANPYVLGTANYQTLRFPGDLKDCTQCHLPGTYRTENVGAKAAVQSPGGFTPTTPPISAACQGCHDDQATASHTLANTTSLGESCNTCHASGADFAVDTVHVRQ